MGLLSQQDKLKLLTPHLTSPHLTPQRFSSEPASAWPWPAPAKPHLSSMATPVWLGSCRSRGSTWETASLGPPTPRRMEWLSRRNPREITRGLASTATLTRMEIPLWSSTALVSMDSEFWTVITFQAEARHLLRPKLPTRSESPRSTNMNTMTTPCQSPPLSTPTIPAIRTPC